MATLKQAGIAYVQIGQIAVRVSGQITSRAFQCRFESLRLVLFPTKTSLIDQSIAQQAKRRCIGRVDRQGPFELTSRLRMRELGKVDVQSLTLEEMLVHQRAAGAFEPHAGMFAKRQPNLKRGHDVLRYTI